MDGTWLPAAILIWPLASGALLALLPLPPAVSRAVAAAGAVGLLGLVGFGILSFDSPPATAAAAGALPLPQLAFRAAWLPPLGSELYLAFDGLNQYGLLALAAALVIAVVVDGLLASAADRSRLVDFPANTSGSIVMSRRSRKPWSASPPRLASQPRR